MGSIYRPVSFTSHLQVQSGKIIFKVFKKSNTRILFKDTGRGRTRIVPGTV